MDSEDLPLHISRETLQQKILRVTKENVVKKCLGMFADLSGREDDYKKVFENLGKCLKLGNADRAKNAELSRFNSFKSGESRSV